MEEAIKSLNDGIGFELQGLTGKVEKATFNKTDNVIDLELSLKNRLTQAIAKDELIDKILKAADVHSTVDNKNIKIIDFEQLKANL